MTSFDQSVRYEVEESVATITLDRSGTRNAFDQAMAEALLAALKTARKDDQVRIVVLTGRGAAFSAGQDIHELQQKETEFGAQAAGDELRKGNFVSMTNLYSSTYKYDAKFWNDYGLLDEYPLSDVLRKDLEHAVKLDDQFRTSGKVEK